MARWVNKFKQKSLTLPFMDGAYVCPWRGEVVDRSEYGWIFAGWLLVKDGDFSNAVEHNMKSDHGEERIVDLYEEGAVCWYRENDDSLKEVDRLKGDLRREFLGEGMSNESPGRT